MPTSRTDLGAKAFLAGKGPKANTIVKTLEQKREKRKSQATNARRAISRKSEADAASIAFRPQCTTGCFKKFGKRTEECIRSHDEEQMTTVSVRKHATFTTVWAVLFLAGMAHRTIPPISGERFSIQIALHTSKGSTTLKKELKDGPKEVSMKIPADSHTWNLINYHVEALARDVQKTSSQIRLESSAALEGKKGLYLNLLPKEVLDLKHAIEEDNGPFAKYIKRHDLTPCVARVLLVDTDESGWDWHTDDVSIDIAKDTIIFHMNWMVTTDYVPGRAGQGTIGISDDTASRKTALTQVLDKPIRPVRTKYLCGKDIVAMDYGHDICGQHGEKKAYLRIWDVEGEGPECDGFPDARKTRPKKKARAETKSQETAVKHEEMAMLPRDDGDEDADVDEPDEVVA